MIEESNKKKDTTILTMDIVSYLEKMNEDERGTTEKLKNSRNIIEKLLDDHLISNNHLHYIKYSQDILKSKYWKN